jgi:hypothetical protein
MPFQKVEFEFPDEENNNPKPDIEIEPSSEIEVDVGGKKAKAAAAEGKRVPPADESEDNFEIEVVDDTPKADRGRKPSEPPADVTDEELEDYSDKVRKRIQHFSKGYHDERRAKEEALRERQELEALTQKLLDENKTLKGTVGKNQTALLEQAKRNTDNDLAVAKRAYKEAYESGDSDAVVEAQEALTNVKLRAEKLNNFRLPSLQEEETPVQSNVEPAPTQVQVDQKAVSWKQENPWFEVDEEMTSFALGLHNRLVREGVSPQSDDYYERINTRMRQVFPDSEEVQQPQRQANVVAPATRSTAPKKIRLTQTQLNLAKRLGLKPEQYAKQVAIDMGKN